MRTIALEEHFVSPNFVSGPGRQFMERLRGSGPRGPRICDQLQELGDARIAEMDAAGLDVQVLSLNSPGVEQADAADQIAMARDANDFLAEAIKKHPTRLAGFAVLPVAAPERAAEELERCDPPARLQGHAHQRPHPRPLSRRQVLLADPGACGCAQCAGLSSSDYTAEGGRRSIVRRILAGGDGDARPGAAGAGTSKQRCISSG